MIKHKIKDITNFLTGLVAILLAAVLSYFIFLKIDLTEYKRFTLHDSTVDLLENLNYVVEFKIYLDGEHLPADLTRVRISILETM